MGFIQELFPAAAAVLSYIGANKSINGVANSRVLRRMIVVALPANNRGWRASYPGNFEVRGKTCKQNCKVLIGSLLVTLRSFASPPVNLMNWDVPPIHSLWQGIR